MKLKLFKLRFRRHLRKQRRQVEGISQQAGQGLDQHFFRRLSKLVGVRRFIFGWLLLFALLIGLSIVQLNSLDGEYQALRPAPGGVYTEGILGSFTNANPLFATNEVDSSVSKLIFASLLKYNSQNRLVGDLAESWSSNDLGTVYTVKLRPNLVWQDGQPLTSTDVAYTYNAIQNPDTQSSLSASWQGVQVVAKDPRTIVFTLSDPLGSFPYNLTNGIVPKHILGKIPMSDLRSAPFNTTSPVGSGPFKWGAVEVTGSTPDSAQEQIALLPFDKYHGGKPKLKRFVVHVFADKNQLIKSFQKKEVDAMAGLDNVPPSIGKGPVYAYNMIVTAANMVFFNNSSSVLQDVRVRKALVYGTDKDSILRSLNYATRAVNEPLLEKQLGYNPAYAQPRYSPTKAKALLNSAGWRVGADGLRHNKQGQPLSFNLYALNSSENKRVIKLLQTQWAKLGVKVFVSTQDQSIFQRTLESRSYDAVLDGIAIGVDPDVFVYWDSSQSDARSNGLNFSQYDSPIADASIEAGRTRIRPRLREVKYQSFLKEWQQDAPALALYQPRFLYITRMPVYGLGEHTINDGVDRFSNVENWETRLVKTTVE